MKHRTLLDRLPALLLTAAAAASLVGCTSADDRAEAPPTPTASAASTAEAQTGACVDGEAVVVVDSDHRDADLADDCAAVSVVGSDGTVTLGDVDHLVVEGTGLRITVDAVGTVDYAGDGNTVSHSGPTPEVHENGTSENVTEAR